MMTAPRSGRLRPRLSEEIGGEIYSGFPPMHHHPGRLFYPSCIEAILSPL